GGPSPGTAAAWRPGRPRHRGRFGCDLPAWAAALRLDRRSTPDAARCRAGRALDARVPGPEPRRDPGILVAGQTINVSPPGLLRAARMMWRHALGGGPADHAGTTAAPTRGVRPGPP